MKTGIIGAGRVGCSLGKYFRSKNADLVGYYDTNKSDDYKRDICF